MDIGANLAESAPEASGNSQNAFMREEPPVAELARRLWVIDAGYLFNAQRSVGAGYQFDYLKLRTRIEQSGPLWRAYYLNSTPHPPTDAQDAFNTWLRSGPPRGPKIITKQTRKAMEKALKEIQSGKFAKTFRAECAKGKPNMNKIRKSEANLPLEKTGRELRKMMTWIDAKEIRT